MDTRRRTKPIIRFQRKKSVIFLTSGRKESKDTSSHTVKEVVEHVPGDIVYNSPEPIEDLLGGKTKVYKDVEGIVSSENDEQDGAGVIIGEEDIKVNANANDTTEEQKAESNDEMEKPFEMAFRSLGMDVGGKTLSTGLEEISVSRLDGTRPETYIGTKDAHTEIDHVVACWSSTSNIVLTIYDNLVSGDDRHVFTSLRSPKNGDISGQDMDEESVALHKLVEEKMYSDLPTRDAGAALGDSDHLQSLSKEILPSVNRVVTMHFYDIPKEVVTPDEREQLYLSRRQQLHHIIPQLKCTTLVLAFENHLMLKHSNLPSFFRRSPKQAGLKIEIRIGSIWSVPVVVPRTRVEKEGIKSTVFARECRELLDDVEGVEGKVGFVGGSEATEVLRCKVLEKLNGVLGEGWLVPYGSRLDENWVLTRMWKNEVWIWE